MSRPPARRVTATAWPVTPAWIVVTDRDGRRCRCHGECGSRHFDRVKGRPDPAPGSPGARCRVAGAPGRPVLPGDLVVAPADPAVPSADAWRLPREELATWCPACLMGASAAARARARRAAAATVADPEGLF